MTVAGATASPSPWLARLTRHRGLIFPIACVALIAVLLVPLPPGLIDILLVLNLTLSILLLATAMYVRSPLELAVLPSLLLAATMFRLTLNVATTRLILTAGSAGVPPRQAMEDAGQVVAAFAGFVTGGSMVVGGITFAIIFVIQFVVITKGATRISEVAARFTLDAMPGRQMAIDADLGAGVIDQRQARQRREEIAQQADFYGAMDGASKFIRGDAVAGILITLVNIAGGMYVGLVERGWELAATAELFTKLTIGDGLVAQVPAFITALGCGLLITRSSIRADLGEQVISQLFSSARPLWIASAFLACLSVTGLPALPLLVLAACTGGLACVLSRKGRSALPPSGETVAALEDKTFERPPEPLEALLELEALELEIGGGLARIVQSDAELLDRISGMRRRVAVELGLIAPPVRVRDSASLNACAYVIRIRGAEVARGEAYRDQFLAIDAGGARGPIPHTLAVEDWPVGEAAYWITESQTLEARRLGYELLGAADAVAAHLEAVVRAQAHALLSRQEVRNLVEHLRVRAPALVEEVIGTQIRLGELHKVLQSLLRRGVSIRDLEQIVETLSDHAEAGSDIERLSEQCALVLAGSTGRASVIASSFQGPGARRSRAIAR